MTLHKQYPADFELLYKSWPKDRPGRTRKYEAWKKFEICKKEFGFDDSDIYALRDCIELMTRERKSWQEGSPYGAKGMQSWFEQRLFLADLEGDYEKAYHRKPDKFDKANKANDFSPLTDEERERSRAAMQEAMRGLNVH